MTAAASAAQEQRRLNALEGCDVLDTPPEEAFDRITRLTSQMFDVPISVMSFVDGHRQWFKSRVGLDIPETERRHSVCYHAIQQDAPLIVPDLSLDPRFKDNPFVTAEGGIRFYAGVPLRNSEGVAVGALCAVDTRPREFGPGKLKALSDFAELASDVLELRELAATDSLTRTLSRRAFRQEGERMLALARRHRHDLSLVLFDLDRFKLINDQHGHPVGDQVLRACADACRAELRTSDVLGRLGGEEFAVALPLTGAYGAMDVAERLRRAIAAIRLPVEGDEISFSGSFGIATLDRTVDGLDALLSRADVALYAAKNDGRNRCEMWQAPAGPAIASPTRRRVFKAGRIVFNSGRSTVDCTVRGLSDREARLDIISSAGIPDSFKLNIEMDGLSRLCRVVTKHDRHLDVAFA